MKVIGTTEAVKRLGASSNRVRALIESGCLKAQKIGREYRHHGAAEPETCHDGIEEIAG